MNDTISKIIEEHLGTSIVILVIALFAFVFLVVWCVRIYYGVKVKMDNMPCTKNGDKIDQHILDHKNVDVNIVKMATTIEFIQKSIESLTQSIQSNNKIVTDPFTQTHSPLSLTDAGKEMVKETGLVGMIDKNWDSVTKLINSCAESMNPYDIQQFCIEQAVVYPEKFLLPEDLDKIKTHAYTTGNSLTSYMRVVAVISRDRYFAENNIDINEVDANNPALKK